MSNNMHTAQHRLVILGSMDEFVQLVCMAQERGIYTIVCDGYVQGPAKKIADKSYTIDIRDHKAVAQMCKDERADGIISAYSDVLAENLVAIAELAELPCYLDSEHLRYLRDKVLMKQMFDELGIPYPKSTQVHQGSAEVDLAPLTMPAVIKPADAWGSHGIHVVNSAAEAEQYFEETSAFSDSQAILAEEYNDGFEFNMMNWVHKGKLYVLEVADREKSQEVAGTTPHVSRIVYPSRLTDRVLEQATDIAAKVAAFVGMQDGPLCMQFFWSPQRGMQVCECAGRIFGYEHELLVHASELSVEEVLLSYVYENDKLDDLLEKHSPYLKRKSAGLYFHGYEDTIASIEGLDQIAALPQVVELHPYYSTGETICHGVGDKPYVVRVYLAADSYEELDQTTQQVISLLKVTNAQGKNLLYASQVLDYKSVLEGKVSGPNPALEA